MEDIKIEEMDKKRLISELYAAQQNVQKHTDEIKQLTNDELCHMVHVENTGKSYLVPEGMIHYIEEMNMNWQKDRDRIKELEQVLLGYGEAAGRLSANFLEENQRLVREIVRLKEVLFCCREIAISDWNDLVVELIDNTLQGFKITRERYLEILGSLKEDKNEK